MVISEETVLKDLAELLAARGPGGYEAEVAAVCRRRLSEFCDDVSTDAAGNIVGLIKGQSRAPGIRVLAHMDENALYVKRIEGDGRLCVRQLGGMYYRRFGDGPVEVLADSGDAIPGVVGLGCRHTAENPGEPRNNTDPRWEQARVNTRLSKKDLTARGVHAGSPVVIAASRRGLYVFQDCVAAHYLDDRGSLAVMLAAGAALSEEGPPPCDVYLVGTCGEETGGGPAKYAVRNLSGEITLALEIGPAAKEYECPLDATPVIFTKDSTSVYTRSVWQALASAGETAGTGSRYVAVERLGSDASMAHQVGHAPKAGCLAFPADNTHGFEVCLPEGLANCSRLLAAYLKTGGAP